MDPSNISWAYIYIYIYICVCDFLPHWSPNKSWKDLVRAVVHSPFCRTSFARIIKLSALFLISRSDASLMLWSAQIKTSMKITCRCSWCRPQEKLGGICLFTHLTVWPITEKHFSAHDVGLGDRENKIRDFFTPNLIYDFKWFFSFSRTNYKWQNQLFSYLTIKSKKAKWISLLGLKFKLQTCL